MHIDMDAFFASVEQRCNPHLRGKPIAVIGAKKRTIITTASYEARKFGVKTGMTVPEAKSLCPRIIFVVGNNEKYTDACVRIVGILKNYSPLVEVYSIDESFVDLTEIQQDPLAVARRIKEDIQQEIGITCSVGIGPNKLIAKLASDRNKPDGLVRVSSTEVPDLLENLPVTELCGIGNKLGARLGVLGIKTCGELGRAPVYILRRQFGIIGEALSLMGRGSYNSPVIPLEESPAAKSVGHSMTLAKDEWDRGRLNRYLLQLAEMVGRRMRKEEFCGRTVCLTVRYSDFQTFSRRTSIKEYIKDSRVIYCIAQNIFTDIKMEKAVRLLGISVSNLRKDVEIPLLEEDQARERLIKAVDQINDIYGEFSVTPATLLERYHHKGVISPAWRPEGTRRTF